MTVERLREVPVLVTLGDEELVRLAAAGRERRLAAGEFLFHQGERASAFHIVLDGQLKTAREVAGEQVLMLTHGPGVGRGTGLGLDIAQRIVVRNHGEVRLQSQPGDTRFQVRLPAR